MVRTRRATAQSEREDGGRIPDGADVREAPCEGAMRAERPPQRRSAITACSRITSVFRPHAQGRGVAAPVAHAMRPGQRRRPRNAQPAAPPAHAPASGHRASRRRSVAAARPDGAVVHDASHRRRSLRHIMPKALTDVQKAKVLEDLRAPDGSEQTDWREKALRWKRKCEQKTKERNITRERNGKRLLEDSEVTPASVADKLDAQEFRCFISDLPLSKPEIISIERRNNDVGYTTSNFGFIHHAFQMSHADTHWTQEKFSEVQDLRASAELPITNHHIEAARAWIEHVSAVDEHLAGGIYAAGPRLDGETLFATRDEAAKATGAYPTHISNVCRPTSKRTKTADHKFWYANGDPPTLPSILTPSRGQYGATRPPLFDKLRTLVYGARSRFKEEHAEPEIDEGVLLDLLESQGRRCAYIGVPLHIDSDWMVSLERINEDEGYLKRNVCLVCHEVNTGCGFQWTPEFAKAVFKF